MDTYPKTSWIYFFFQAVKKTGPTYLPTSKKNTKQIYLLPLATRVKKNSAFGMAMRLMCFWHYFC